MHPEGAAMSGLGLEGMVDVALGDGATSTTETPSVPRVSISDESKSKSKVGAESRASETVESQSSGLAAAAAAAASKGGESVTHTHPHTHPRHSAGACLASSHSTHTPSLSTTKTRNCGRHTTIWAPNKSPLLPHAEDAPHSAPFARTRCRARCVVHVSRMQDRGRR